MKQLQLSILDLAIIIEGGNVEFKNDWYKCKKCFKLIQGIENHIKILYL